MNTEMLKLHRITSFRIVLYRSLQIELLSHFLWAGTVQQRNYLYRLLPALLCALQTTATLLIDPRDVLDVSNSKRPQNIETDGQRLDQTKIIWSSAECSNEAASLRLIDAIYLANCTALRCTTS